MNPYVEILRPGNAIMGAISIVLIALIDKTISIPIILAIITVFFETAAGNVINDCFDYDIDLINKPERPIPSGRISLRKGKNYAYLLFLAGTICGFLISYLTNNWIPFIIVLIADVILYLYAYKLKATPLIGNLAVGFMTGFGFVFGGYTINNPSIVMTSIFLGFFAFVMTTAREIVKDIEDIEGDKADGAKMWVVHSFRNISGHRATAFDMTFADVVKNETNTERELTLHRRSEERRVGKECRSRWSPYH